ncbi:hypothetical protein FRB99_003166 [Tulasnella sp. 403]|nr:hypothetical protein FRB99_003166 [Tulasnella sp. 403]
MYGMDSPRLDRLQNLPEYMKSQQGTSSFISTMEVLVFFLNVAIHNRLMNLFNARVVYQRHWRIFFDDMRLAWAKMRTIGIVILAADVLLIASGKSIYFTAASASLAGASVYSSVYLHQKHPEHQLATGPDISVYVMSVENYYYGLRPLSIILTLPHALVIYAAVFLHTALLFIVLKEVTGIDQTILAFGSLWVGAAPIVATAYFFAEPAAHAQAREGRRQCSLFGIFHKLLECASRKPRAVTDRGGGP